MTAQGEETEIGRTIARSDIEGEDDTLVGIVPSRKSGVEFVRENNAWGFPRMSREPEYLAIYISENIQKVKYIAKVTEVVKAGEASLAKSVEEYGGYDPSKKVVFFDPDNVYELEDPIPYGSRTVYPPIRYTSLGKFKSGESTDDLF